jgi:hypothetical protein
MSWDDAKFGDIAVQTLERDRDQTSPGRNFEMM